MAAKGKKKNWLQEADAAEAVQAQQDQQKRKAEMDVLIEQARAAATVASALKSPDKEPSAESGGSGEKKKYYRVTVSLNEEQCKKLRMLAAANMKTMSGMMQQMIEEHA